HPGPCSGGQNHRRDPLWHPANHLIRTGERSSAGEPGFEPGTRAPKTPVIPFHHSPTTRAIVRDRPLIISCDPVPDPFLQCIGLGRTSHSVAFPNVSRKRSLEMSIRVLGGG